MTARARRCVLLLLAVLLIAATACSDSSDDVVTDPTQIQVDAALRFGVLAPLPPGAQVIGLEREDERDPYVFLAIRMPISAVEAFLAASRLGPFAPYTYAPAQTVFQQYVPDAAPTTGSTTVINPVGLYVYRAAAMETVGPGIALVHIWLQTT